jgi:hypothetical protein
MCREDGCPTKLTQKTTHSARLPPLSPAKPPLELEENGNSKVSRNTKALNRGAKENSRGRTPMLLWPKNHAPRFGKGANRSTKLEFEDSYVRIADYHRSPRAVLSLGRRGVEVWWLGDCRLAAVWGIKGLISVASTFRRGLLGVAQWEQ